MKPCKECGKPTLSFVDIISRDGAVETYPCCVKCISRLTKGLKKTKAGDFVKHNVLIRYFRREYKPMAQLEWLFYLANK